MHDAQLYTSLLENPLRLGGCMIILERYDLDDACIHEELGTDIAWNHLAIYRAAFERDSEPSSLDEGILLCVYCSDAMHALMAIIMNDLVHLMPDLIAMGQSGRGADVSGNENALVFCDYAAGASAVTCASRSNHLGNRHEVLIPRRTDVIIGANGL